MNPLGATRLLLLAIMACAVLAVPTQTALAQGPEIPPFPILYGGRAYVDGVPVPEGTRVEARVGDYVTWTTVGPQGLYLNLVVGPPSRTYHFMPITFHATGLTADESDVFLPSREPLFKHPDYDLHFSDPDANTVPEPDTTPEPVATATVDAPQAEPTATATATAEPAPIEQTPTIEPEPVEATPTATPEAGPEEQSPTPTLTAPPPTPAATNHGWLRTWGLRFGIAAASLALLVGIWLLARRVRSR